MPIEQKNPLHISWPRKYHDERKATVGLVEPTISTEYFISSTTESVMTTINPTLILDETVSSNATMVNFDENLNSTAITDVFQNNSTNITDVLQSNNSMGSESFTTFSSLFTDSTQNGVILETTTEGIINTLTTNSTTTSEHHLGMNDTSVVVISVLSTIIVVLLIIIVILFVKYKRYSRGRISSTSGVYCVAEFNKSSSSITKSTISNSHEPIPEHT